MADEPNLTPGKVPLRLVNEPRIIVTISQHMADVLDELVESGMYGTTPADAARRLLERGMIDNLTLEDS